MKAISSLFLFFLFSLTFADFPKKDYAEVKNIEQLKKFESQKVFLQGEFVANPIKKHLFIPIPPFIHRSYFNVGNDQIMVFSKNQLNLKGKAVLYGVVTATKAKRNENDSNSVMFYGINLEAYELENGDFFYEKELTAQEAKKIFLSQNHEPKKEGLYCIEQKDRWILEKINEKLFNYDRQGLESVRMQFDSNMMDEAKKALKASDPNEEKKKKLLDELKFTVTYSNYQFETKLAQKPKSDDQDFIRAVYYMRQGVSKQFDFIFKILREIQFRDFFVCDNEVEFKIDKKDSNYEILIESKSKDKGYVTSTNFFNHSAKEGQYKVIANRDFKIKKMSFESSGSNPVKIEFSFNFSDEKMGYLLSGFQVEIKDASGSSINLILEVSYQLVKGIKFYDTFTYKVITASKSEKKQGNLNFRVHDIEAAPYLGDLSEQISIKPKKAELYLERGRLYLDHRKYSYALNDFNRAIELNKDLGVAYYYRGKLYFSQEKNDAALKDLLFALPLLTQKEDCLFLLGKVLYEKKDYDSALSYFEQLSKILPLDPAVWFKIGEANKALNQKDGAYQAYLTAISAYPEAKNQKGLKPSVFEFSLDECQEKAAEIRKQKQNKNLNSLSEKGKEIFSRLSRIEENRYSNKMVADRFNKIYEDYQNEKDFNAALFYYLDENFYQYRWILYYILDPYYTDHPKYNLAMDVAQKGLELSGRYPENIIKKGYFLFQIGSLYWTMGEKEKAGPYFIESFKQEKTYPVEYTSKQEKNLKEIKEYYKINS